MSKNSAGRPAWQPVNRGNGAHSSPSAGSRPASRPVSRPSSRPSGPARKPARKLGRGRKRRVFGGLIWLGAALIVLAGALWLGNSQGFWTALWPPSVDNAQEYAPEPVAPYPDVQGFTPGNIMADGVFFDPSRMDASSVDAFMRKIGKGCRPAANGLPCLPDYHEDVAARPATAYCGAYAGGQGLTAAQIITGVSQACGINPQVILVTLQKEQGLLTASSGRITPQRYNTAMGYGCPDNGTCNPKYFGFSNQVYSAAAQFQMYRLGAPGKYRYWPGQDAVIPYNPDPSCGAQTVHIENQATAGLYNYTPYQPNEPVLMGHGFGDDCSSYGNANFYGYFKLWFGDPRQP